MGEIGRGWRAPAQHERPLRSQAEPVVQQTTDRPLLLAGDSAEFDVIAEGNPRQGRDEQLRCGALVAGGQRCRSTRRHDHVTIVGEQELAATCEKMVKIVAARAAEHRSIDAVRMVEVRGGAPSDAGESAPSDLRTSPKQRSAG